MDSSPDVRGCNLAFPTPTLITIIAPNTILNINNFTLFSVACVPWNRSIWTQLCRCFKRITSLKRVATAEPDRRY